MANGISTTAGRAGSLMATVGVISFFLGIFGMPRTFMFAGAALIVLSLVAYFIQEFEERRS